jgi:hypothetical protein
LPRATPATADAETRSSLGSIFKPARPRAVVEADVALEPRSLDLDEGEVETPELPADAPSIPEVEVAPAVALRAPTPEPVSLSPIGVPDSPVPETIHRAGGHAAVPMVLPELNAPPEMPLAPTAPAKKSGGLGLVVVVVLLLAGIAAGAYFATR